MKIYFDLSSTKSDHQFRGIGFYTQRLFLELGKLASENYIQLVSQKEPDIDLYHFPAFNPFFFSFPLQLIKHSIITIHDLIPLEFPQHYPPGLKGGLKWQIQKHYLRNAAGIITDSKASQESINKITGIKINKINPIYLAADSVFKPIKDKKSFNLIKNKYNLESKFILYVGDLNWNKNIVRLVKSCLELRFPLIVVGKQAINKNIDKNHPWNQELVVFQKLADKNPKLIKCLGFVSTEDLIGFYNLATCLVMPSIAEGFGLPILEAMQCGCPVICSNLSSLSEIADKAALLIDPLDIESIKKGLNIVWKNKQTRENFSHLGIKQASRFSWGKTAKQTIEVYKYAYEKKIK